MMNYHFGSVGRYKLETLINDLVNDGFSRLDPFFIDPDEYTDPGRPDHWWIPSKVALYTPVTLIQEVQKSRPDMRSSGHLFRRDHSRLSPRRLAMLAA